MSVVDIVDRYSSTLASGYTAGGTSLSVASAATLPSGACDFYLLVKAEGANTEEVFHVTNVTGTTLTVAGAQANTSASNHASGAQIVGSVWTKAAFQSLFYTLPPASAGAIGGVNSKAAVSHQFLTQIATDGSVSAAQPADADIAFSDVTTGNVSITEHGFAPKAPNDATKYLDGTGAYSVPAGSGSPNFADSEIPSGTIDGSNPTFTLAHTPVSGSEHVYLRGLRMMRGTASPVTGDYSISGGTITMTNIPGSGDAFFVDYRY